MNHKVAFTFSDGKTKFFTAPENEVVLDAAIRNGINIPIDCREGVCATCVGQCESGTYTMDYVDEEALSAQDLEEGKILTCQTRVQSDATFYFDFDSTLCTQATSELIRGVVTSVELVSSSTAIISINTPHAPNRIDYLPGQYARINVPGTEAWRAYSFASLPNDNNELKFIIRLLPTGMMSDYVRDRCSVGDEICFEAPFGAFYLRQIERPLVMVAGGTGLSAFLGMLDRLVKENGASQIPPVHLYHGVRKPEDLCELDRIQKHADELPGLQFFPVISQAPDDWNGRRGYVTDHFEEHNSSYSEADVYICGAPAMVDSVKEWFSQQTSGSTKVYFEKFTKSTT